MEKITLNTYTYAELSDKAKEKALSDYNQDGDSYHFLQDDLREYIHEMLTEKGYTHDEITPFYSLSYCQGDGLMFETKGLEDGKGNVYDIKHSGGSYNHERMTNITGYDIETGDTIDTEDFNENIYVPICKAVASRGYLIIEEAESEENFIDTCEANDYMFFESGELVSDNI
jgi:hypothetical protein